jgi:cytochrome c553
VPVGSIKKGEDRTRNGVSAQLMKLIVANLTEEDIVNVAAHVASRVSVGQTQPAGQVRTIAER